MRRELLRTGAFIRAAKRIVKKGSTKAADLQTALELLEADAFDSRLQTHKLSGTMAGTWACSAGYDLRIVFSFVKRGKSEAVLLESVGSHDEVY